MKPKHFQIVAGGRSGARGSLITQGVRISLQALCMLCTLWMPQFASAQTVPSSPDPSVVAGGGGGSTGAGVKLVGTIGQPEAGALVGPGVSLYGGFWSLEAVPMGPAAANPEDPQLSLSDWLLAWEAGVGGLVWAAQMDAGGNPGAYRVITNATAGDAVRSFSILRAGSFAPEVLGELGGIDFRFDVLSQGGASLQVGPALLQQGRYYYAPPSDFPLATTWTSQAWTHLVDTDFRTVNSAADHPDFSLKGGEIRFGYYVFTPGGVGTQQTVVGVDNFSASPETAPAPSYVIWTNTAGGNWTTAANWSPHRVPGEKDIAVIAAPGNYTVNLDYNAACSMLLLGGAPGTQSLDWSYGGFAGYLYVEPNAVVNLTGSSLSLGGTIKNHGRLIWSGGKAKTWRWEEGARLDNQPDGFVDIRGEGSFYWMGTDSRLFRNAGTVRVASGLGQLGLYPKIELQNEGQILVESGALALHNFQSSGLVSVSQGATLELNGGLVRLEPCHSFQGTGTWWINGDVDLHGALNAPATFSVSEAGTFDSELNATMGWTNGTLAGNLTIGRAGTLNFLANGGGSMWMTGVITNQGVLKWTGSRDNWIWYEGGRLENLSEGLIDFDFDATLNLPSGAFLHNYGTLRKSGGTDQASFRGVGAHHNYGLLDVQSGTLEFLHGLASSGEIHVETGAVLSFTGGDCRFGPAHRFTGEGLCSFGGSSVHILGPMAGTVQFKMVYGTVFDASLDANLSWDYGNMSGTLSVGANGLLTLNAPGSLEGTVVNQGRILWPAGPAASWRWEDGATLENRAGGLFEIQGDHRLYAGGIGMRIDNAGTWRKSQGTSAMRIDPNFSFQNSGSVEVQSGMILFQGAYLASPSAILLVQLGGETEGVGYAQAQFGKPLGLAGTFGVTLAEGYMPRVGARFGVLEYPSRAGSFANLTGLDLGGGIHLVPQFTSTGLALLATNGVLPSVGISIEPGSLRVTWPAEDSGWRLYSATNLIAPDWKLVPLPAGSTVDLLPAHPQEFYRLGSP